MAGVDLEEGAGPGDALLLARGELVESAFGAIREVHGRESGEGGGPWDARAGHRDEVGGCEAEGDVRLAGDVGEAAGTLGGRPTWDRLPGECDGARLGRELAEQASQEGGFARGIRARDDQHPAGRERDGDICENGRRVSIAQREAIGREDGARLCGGACGHGRKGIGGAGRVVGDWVVVRVVGWGCGGR